MEPAGRGQRLVKLVLEVTETSAKFQGVLLLALLFRVIIVDGTLRRLHLHHRLLLLVRMEESIRVRLVATVPKTLGLVLGEEGDPVLVETVPVALPLTVHIVPVFQIVGVVEAERLVVSLRVEEAGEEGEV